MSEVNVKTSYISKLFVAYFTCIVLSTTHQWVTPSNISSFHNYRRCRFLYFKKPTSTYIPLSLHWKLFSVATFHVPNHVPIFNPFFKAYQLIIQSLNQSSIEKATLLMEWPDTTLIQWPSSWSRRSKRVKEPTKKRGWSGRGDVGGDRRTTMMFTVNLSGRANRAFIVSPVRRPWTERNARVCGDGHVAVWRAAWPAAESPVQRVQANGTEKPIVSAVARPPRATFRTPARNTSMSARVSALARKTRACTWGEKVFTRPGTCPGNIRHVNYCAPGAGRCVCPGCATALAISMPVEAGCLMRGNWPCKWNDRARMLYKGSRLHSFRGGFYVVFNLSVWSMESSLACFGQFFGRFVGSLNKQRFWLTLCTRNISSSGMNIYQFGKLMNYNNVYGL